MYHPFSDDVYYMDLSKFKLRNRNATEIDFLIDKIKFWKNLIIEQQKISDLDIKLKVEQDMIDFVDDVNYQEYFKIQLERECRVVNRDGNIRKAEGFINYYKEKLKLKKLLSNEKVKESMEEKNPYPDIFIDFESFQIFNKYLKSGLVTPYKDLSFLFQKLKTDKRLISIKHLDFALWMLDNKFIKNIDYDVILNKKGFDSKSSSDERLNRYINIKKDLK